MSPGEVFHRSSERRRMVSKRLRRPKDCDSAVNDWPAGFPLRACAMTLSSYEGSESLRVSQLASFQRGEITLLGQDWPGYDLFPDWHLDPISGKHWPRSHAFSINYRD